jgi:hypothetical protein
MIFINDKVVCSVCFQSATPKEGWKTYKDLGMWGWCLRKICDRENAKLNAQPTGCEDNEHSVGRFVETKGEP